jgi:SAM-dependent methyltransferase
MRPGRLFAERLTSLNRFKAGGRILDVGCGDGCFLSVLKSAGWEAFGTEIDDAVVQSLRRQGLEVYGGKLPGLQLPQSSFDVITYFGSFEHVDQPLEELEAAKRILGKDGLLLLYLTNAGSLEARAFGPKWMGYEAPRHRFNYTPQTLRLMLTIKGFQLLATDNRNDDFITSFSLACRLGLRSRYTTLEKPLKWLFRPMHYLTRRFNRGNVFEVAARPVA